MTALKPSESWLVRAVASERYPINKTCAHPDCREDAVDPHHAFPRSFIGGDSWFVAIHEPAPAPVDEVTTIIPHVTGLCREHHDDVEEHRAWIKLEDDEFRWYDRADSGVIGPAGQEEHADDPWRLLGPLNPQPGSREGRPKRKRHKDQARRQRKTISLRVPQDAEEDGAGIWDDLIEQLEARINPKEDDRRPPYYTIIDALNYTLLNSGEDDFV